MNIIIKCRGHTLHKNDDTPIEVSEELYIIKKIKLLMISLFGDYHYGNFSFIDRSCEVILSPEFYEDIPIGYSWR